MMQVILASASPRRRQLFKKLGLPFKVVPSRVREKLPKTTKNPKKLVQKLALLKARAVANPASAYSDTNLSRGGVKDALIIAADTIVVLKDKVIGKPKNLPHAKEILRQLSGETQYVITGIAIINTSTNKVRTAAVSTKVKMKKMTQKQIDCFAKKHLDKAGAYAVQEKGDEFIESIEGSFSNVVGLPLEKLKSLLGK